MVASATAIRLLQYALPLEELNGADKVKPIRQLQANVEECSAYAKDPDISTALGL
ncbi:unnamed protein product [Cladocopium goreaui]|uniref:Uncharacterized protein n=1 Tax=Cladocopium goreaui TaxID=2562237 RepID=A0A9P1CN48_9DINO|nr:unnamed protein product [Cladocopium goreaui]